MKKKREKKLKNRSRTWPTTRKMKDPCTQKFKIAFLRTPTPPFRPFWPNPMLNPHQIKHWTHSEISLRMKKFSIQLRKIKNQKRSKKETLLSSVTSRKWTILLKMMSNFCPTQNLTHAKVLRFPATRRKSWRASRFKLRKNLGENLWARPIQNPNPKAHHSQQSPWAHPPAPILTPNTAQVPSHQWQPTCSTWIQRKSVWCDSQQVIWWTLW